MTGCTRRRRSARRTAGSAPVPRPGPRPPACRGPGRPPGRSRAGGSFRCRPLPRPARSPARQKLHGPGPPPGHGSHPHARRSAGPGPARPCPDGTAAPAGRPGPPAAARSWPGPCALAGLGGDLIQRPQQAQPAGEADFLPRAGPGILPGRADDPKTAGRRLGPVQDDTDLHTPIVPAPAAPAISQLAYAPEWQTASTSILCGITRIATRFTAPGPFGH